MEDSGQREIETGEQGRGEHIAGLHGAFDRPAKSLALAPEHADRVQLGIDHPVFVDTETLVDSPLDGFVALARAWGSNLDDQVRRMSPCDLLLIEGYKRYPMPKLEVWRHENGKPFLHPEDEHIVALATDVPQQGSLPRFDLDDHDAIADFVMSYNRLK